jgi:DNA primase
MNILELIEADGFALKRVAATHGGEYAGPCPFCGGNDRFLAWPEEGDGGRYWCRQCNRSGDRIQYLRDVRKMSFQDACRLIGKEVSTPNSSRLDKKGRARQKTPGETWAPRETAAPPNLWQERAQAVLHDSEGWLFQPHPLAQDTLKWLVEQRGLTLDTIRAQRLGLVMQDRWDGHEQWGLEPVAKQDGNPKKIWVPRGLTIPLCQDGTVLRLRIRRFKEDGDPRYYLLRGSDTRALILGKERDVFVVVESELDTILLHQEAGDSVGVIALGNAQARPDQDTKQALGRARLILIALDADNPGAQESWRWWQKKFRHSRRWPPIDGKDMPRCGRRGWA